MTGPKTASPFRPQHVYGTIEESKKVFVGGVSMNIEISVSVEFGWRERTALPSCIRLWNSPFQSNDFASRAWPELRCKAYRRGETQHMAYRR